MIRLLVRDLVRLASVLAFLSCGALPLAATEQLYLAPGDLELTPLLAPAPAPDSAVTREDLRILLDLQAARTPETIAQANADVPRTLTRFSDVVGTDLSAERAPRATALIAALNAEMMAMVLPVKERWRRPRPYILFPEVRLAVPPEDTFSYPSGHSTFGASAAIILAGMVPEKAAAIFARGAQYGFERALAGVHYPSDVEAGRLAGVALAAALLRSPRFRADRDAARAEIRRLLGLPDLAPAAQPTP